MAREKEHFRDELERLDRVFPNEEILSCKQVSEFLGICKNSVAKHIPKNPLGYSKVKIANFLVSYKK